MSGLANLGDSVGVKVLGGSSCGAKYGGKKGKRSTKKAKKSKKARKSKKSKKSGKRKTSKKTFLARLFKV